MKNHQSPIINPPSSDTDDPLYREIILEHWQNPQNFGVVKHAGFDIKGNNPTCGDSIRITGIIKSNKLVEIKFVGEGCAISKASASLFTEFIKGKKITQLKKLTENDALKKLPIEITPSRHNCALLCIRTLQKLWS